MNYQRGIQTARPRYAGAPGQAPGGNQKKDGKPVMVTGEMGLIDAYTAISNIAECASDQFGSIAWEFMHGTQEEDEDVETGSAQEKSEKRQINLSRKDSRDRMIQYVCKNHMDENVKLMMNNIDSKYVSSKSLVSFRALILRAVSSNDATMDGTERNESVQELLKGLTDAEDMSQLRTNLQKAIAAADIASILNMDDKEVKTFDQEEIMKYLIKSMNGPLKSVANLVMNRLKGFKAYEKAQHELRNAEINGLGPRPDDEVGEQQDNRVIEIKEKYVAIIRNHKLSLELKDTAVEFVTWVASQTLSPSKPKKRMQNLLSFALNPENEEEEVSGDEQEISDDEEELDHDEQEMSVDEEEINGDEVCDGCGGDHVIRDCPHPIVIAKIAEIDEYVQKQMAELKETMAQKKYVNKKSCKKNESRHAEKVATLLSTAITELVQKTLEDGAPRSSERAVNYDSSDSDSE